VWSRYSNVVAMTVGMYYHVTTIDEEVDFIWFSRWGLGKILFLLLRYYNLVIIAVNTAALMAPTLGKNICALWSRWQLCSALAVSLLTPVVLQARLYAMYGGSRKILLFVGACYTGAAIAYIVILSKIWTADFIQPPVGNVLSHFCSTTDPQGNYKSLFYPLVCLEAVMFGLVLYSGFKSFRRHFIVPNRGFGSMALTVLVKDSIFYFFIIFAAYTVEICITTIVGPVWEEVPAPWVVTTGIVCCQHLVLNIRRHYSRSLDLSSASLSTFMAL